MSPLLRPLDRLAALSRADLGFFPTPLVELRRLSAALGGPRILMKRDDQTGLAFGGNKTRKLEFLVGEALSLGCDTLVTGGAAQSNHCRQTAAAAAAMGLDCHLALGGLEPELLEGNLLLDALLGATIHWGGERRKGEDIPHIADELEAAGKKPYIIPYGGSNGVGALGFVAAALELGDQLRDRGIEADAIVFASSSGGTQAGLEVGLPLAGLRARPLAIGIDKVHDGRGGFVDEVRRITVETAERIGIGCGSTGGSGPDPASIAVREDFLGAGYGIVGEAEREAIGLVARLEGILLDPVYTGKAFAGLIAMVRRGEFTKGQTLLFWHTGGAPALFPYARTIISTEGGKNLKAKEQS